MKTTGCISHGVMFAAAALLATALAGSASAQLTRAEIIENLERGEASFRRALELDQSDPVAANEYFRRTIMRFELIAGEGGVRNGKLYYNIGNAYFRLGDVGRAILNYRRAALYIPNDPNLRQNLEYARSRRLDRIEKNEGEKVLGTLFFFHYDLPSGVKLWIFTTTFAAAWIAALIFFLFRSGMARIALFAAGIIAIVFLVSLVVESFSAVRRPAGVIVSEEVVARKGDAETYQPSFTEPLHAGAEFNLLERRSGWWHIELVSGVRTWVPSRSAELLFD